MKLGNKRMVKASCRIHFYIWAKVVKLPHHHHNSHRILGDMLSPESLVFLRNILRNIWKSGSLPGFCWCVNFFFFWLFRLLLCNLLENFTFIPEILLLIIIFSKRAIPLKFQISIYAVNFLLHWYPLFSHSQVNTSRWNFLSNAGFDIGSPGIPSSVCLVSS